MLIHKTWLHQLDVRKWCFGLCLCRIWKYLVWWHWCNSVLTCLFWVHFSPPTLPQCLAVFFHDWNCFSNLFLFLQFYVKTNFFNLSHKNQLLLIQDAHLWKTNISHLLFCVLIKFSTTFSSKSYPRAISLAFLPPNGSVP